MTPLLAPGTRAVLRVSLWTTVPLAADTWLDLTFHAQFREVRVLESKPAWKGNPSLRMTRQIEKPQGTINESRCRVYLPRALVADDLVDLGRIWFVMGWQADGIVSSPAIASIDADTESPWPSTNIPGADFSMVRVHMGGIICRVPMNRPLVRVMMEVE